MFSRAIGRPPAETGNAGSAPRPPSRLALAGGALVIFASFGAFVAVAGDDAGVHDFIRRETGNRSGSRPPASLPPIFAPPARLGGSVLGGSVLGGSVLGFAPSGARMTAQTYRHPQGGQSLADARSAFRSGSANHEVPPRTTPIGERGSRKLLADGAESRTTRLPSRHPVAYCVRLCDGYFFPLSRPNASAADLQTSCSNLCPSAKTRLYSAPAGSAGIEQARFRGEPYANLATAFLHRTMVSKACTCTAIGYGLEAQDLRTDATFRRGDVLVLKDRLKVYSGQETGRNRPNDFAPIETSSLLTRAERRQLSALVLHSVPRDQQKIPTSVTIAAPDPALRLTPLETQGAARFERIAPQASVRIVQQESSRPDPAQHP